MSDIKEIQGRRLYRALRRLFKVRDFKFAWTNYRTAYWDGTTMHILYAIEHPLRTYSEAETHIIRQGLAYHEMGHKLYDDLKVLTNWIKDNGTNNSNEWEANIKWPSELLRNLSNIALDGRLEYALKLEYPFTAESIDFVNDYWAFFIGNTPKSKSKFEQFMSLLSCRLLKLKDLHEYDEDVIALLESGNQHISEMINAGSTQECLESLTPFIQKIFPTLYEWAKDEKVDLTSQDTSNPKSKHILTDWDSLVTPQEKEANNRSVQQRLQNMDESNEKTNERATDYSMLISEAEAEVKEAIAEQSQYDSYEENEEVTSIITHFKDKDIVNEVHIKNVPKDKLDLDGYREITNKLAVNSVAKVLKEILAPVPDEMLKNARTGKFQPHLAWKGTKCDNMQMFHKRMQGLPKAEAYLSCMADISGSTCGLTHNGVQIIDEMKQALSVILTAAHKINLPSKAHAFTTIPDSHNSLIYRIKPYENQFTVNDLATLGGLSPAGGNRDVAALQYLIDDLSQRNDEIRIGIMFSDGSPIFFNGESEAVISDMVKKAEAKGIEILCLFIGRNDAGYQRSKRMYGNRVIRSQKTLTRDLKEQLVKLLAKKRY